MLLQIIKLLVWVFKICRRYKRIFCITLFTAIMVIAPTWYILAREKDNINFTPMKTPHIIHIRNVRSADYHRLLDLKNFTYTMLKKPCDHESLFIIIIAHSAPSNIHKRMTIRETWGRKMQNVKLFFMLGVVANQTQQHELLQEDELHHDLIQGSFMDSYKNLTYKHTAVLKFVVYHCPSAKYLLKVDDDVFVNMPYLYKYLQELSINGAKNLILCQLKLKSTYPDRGCGLASRVSYKEFPYFYYPPYCNGYSVLYSNDVVLKLYFEAQYGSRPYFWIDDVFITGLLVKDLGLRHSYIRHIVLNRKMCNSITVGGLNERVGQFFFARENLEAMDIETFWNYTMIYMNVSPDLYVNATLHYHHVQESITWENKSSSNIHTEAA